MSLPLEGAGDLATAEGASSEFRAGSLVVCAAEVVQLGRPIDDVVNFGAPGRAIRVAFSRVAPLRSSSNSRFPMGLR